MNMRALGFLRGLENLLLGLWVGGLVFLAAFTAPVIFRAFESRAAAGSVVGVIIEKFSGLEHILAILLFFIALILLLITEKNAVRTYASLAVVFMFLLATFYIRVLQPQLQALRSQVTTIDLPVEKDTSPARRQFETLHRGYSALVAVNLLLGISVLVVKGFDTAGRRKRIVSSASGVTPDAASNPPAGAGGLPEKET